MRNNILQALIGVVLALKMSVAGAISWPNPCDILPCPTPLRTPNPLSKENRSIILSESIYMRLFDARSLDRDRDGLKDELENRLADTWRPYFIFDEEENALQGFEPVVIFRVSPLDNWHPRDWPRRIRIIYGYLWRKDGGYEGAPIETNSHWGDTSSGSYELKSADGKSWTLEKVSLWDGPGTLAADSLKIEWTEPRSTYWGQMPNRPSPIIHASSGKHHLYISKASCESWQSPIHPFENDDCDEGVQRMANLAPAGAFTNVGEPQHHGPPFVDNLATFGYANEHVWWAAWQCDCGDGSVDCFTGGKGDSWPGGLACVAVTPVYKVMQRHVEPGRQLGLDARDIAVMQSIW